MKRFLVFLIVAIAVTSLGLTIYYFSKDNEVIFINNTQISVNVGDTFSADSLLKFENASKYTKVDYNGVQDESVLSYKKNEGFYAAIAGGETKIVITTSNRSYSNLVINVIVRDGSEEFPYIIDSETKLRQIGKDSKFTLDGHYELGKSIILSEKWTPIDNFTGSIDGAGYTISNIDISKYTDAEIEKTKFENESGVLANSEKTQEYLDYNTALANLEYAGFIGRLASNGETIAKISNLTLKNVNIHGDFSYVGAVAARNEGEIHNCHVSTDSHVELEYAGGQVINEKTVYNTIQSTKGNAVVGGVAGISDSYTRTVAGINKGYTPVIERCTSAARIYINATTQVVGGIVGHTGASQVSECMFDGYALSNVAAAPFGGIVGTNSSTKESTIIDCLAVVNTIDTSAVTAVGGDIYNNVSTGNNDREHHLFGLYTSALRTYKADGSYTETDITSVKVSYNADAIKNSRMLTAAMLKVTTNYETYRQVLENGSDYVRTWDFENVWVIDETKGYPTINKSSAAGSIYQIDYSTVKGSNDFSSSDTAAVIYNKIASNTNGSFNIASDIDMQGYEWTPIASFSGTLTGTPDSNGKNPVVSNITLVLDSANKNQGLFNILDSTAIINNITFDNITIKNTNGQGSARYVGTLAGECNGASLNNVNVKNVTVQDMTFVGFGGVVGYNDYSAGKATKNVSATNVNFVNSYAKIAGGIAAVNTGVICGDAALNTFVTATNNNMIANQLGGIVGINYRTVAYAKADVSYVLAKENANVFGTTKFIQVGGIVGYNAYGSYAALVKNSSASVDFTVDTVKTYTVYAGGIAGYNAGAIYNSHAHDSNITSNNSYKIFAGGISGVSTGAVDVCLVDSTNIKTSTTCIEKDNESYVGGVVGLLTSSKSTNKAGVVGRTVSKATTVEGFFAGGLAGYSYGAVYMSYAEGTSIKGFYAGGLAGVINTTFSSDKALSSFTKGYDSGMFKYCYAIVTLENVNSSIDMSAISTLDIYNQVASYDKGASAGVAVLVIKGSVVDNCYVVINYKGEGAKASTTFSRYTGSSDASVHDQVHSGIIKNTIYTNKQLSMEEEGATFVSEDALRPTEGIRYKVFEDNGFNTEVWTAEIGSLPKLVGLDNLIANLVA